MERETKGEGGKGEGGDYPFLHKTIHNAVLYDYEMDVLPPACPASLLWSLPEYSKQRSSSTSIRSICVHLSNRVNSAFEAQWGIRHVEKKEEI